MTFIGLLVVISSSSIFILHNTVLSFFGIRDMEKKLIPVVESGSVKKVKNLKWVHVLVRVTTTITAFIIIALLTLVLVKLGVGDTTERLVFMVALLTSFFLYIEMMMTSVVGQRVIDNLLKDLQLKAQ